MNNLPRIAGSDLRQASAASARVEAVDSEAMEAAAVPAMERTEVLGEATESASPAPTWQAYGQEEGVKGSQDLAAELGEDAGVGRSGRRRREHSHGQQCRGSRERSVTCV